MQKDTIYALSIFYLNGKVQKYAFRQQDEDMNITKNIESFLNSEHVTIMLDNKMVIIPMKSIERFELTPVPKAWPKNTIYNAKLIE